MPAKHQSKQETRITATTNSPPHQQNEGQIPVLQLRKQVAVELEKIV